MKTLYFENIIVQYGNSLTCNYYKVINENNNIEILKKIFFTIDNLNTKLSDLKNKNAYKVLIFSSEVSELISEKIAIIDPHFIISQFGKNNDSNTVHPKFNTVNSNSNQENYNFDGKNIYFEGKNPYINEKNNYFEKGKDLSFNERNLNSSRNSDKKKRFIDLVGKLNYEFQNNHSRKIVLISDLFEDVEKLGVQEINWRNFIIDKYNFY